MNQNNPDLIVIGGGPAGLTAAIYASRASINTLVIEGSPAGGQLTITSDVENFPGFPDGIKGPDFIAKSRQQALRFGAKFVEDNVVAVSGDATGGFVVTTQDNGGFNAKTIVVASGASARWVGLESEKRLIGKGVSACATCDGFFFKNKVVAVVGGGDSAMEEATFLTKFASKVYILVRGSKEQLRASKFMFQKAMNNPRIEFKFNSQIKEIVGETKVTGVVVTEAAGISKDYSLPDVEGVFVAIGHSPNTKFLQGFVDLDKLGYLDVKNNTLTSVEGVFAAGDAADHEYRQAVTAAGFGCMAALDAERFLTKLSDV